MIILYTFSQGACNFEGINFYLVQNQHYSWWTGSSWAVKAYKQIINLSKKKNSHWI